MADRANAASGARVETQTNGPSRADPAEKRPFLNPAEHRHHDFHPPMPPLPGGWWTTWKDKPAVEQIMSRRPPRHSDYRDSLPPTLKEVVELYRPVVKQGAWTHGLLEMWNGKNKFVKQAVHIPCWDSFKWNPFLWRGVCFGRTCNECFWTGTRQMRWARMVLASRLGREYEFFVKDVGKHAYRSEAEALCWLYFIMGCAFSCGIGQIFSLCGNLGVDFAAPYSCNARRKMRAKYNLAPSFGLPPGIDDCLVHFFCSYCASHQELRELAMRGVDGPGMHIFDVLPKSHHTAPGHAEAVAARAGLVEQMMKHPPKRFLIHPPKEQAMKRDRTGEEKLGDLPSSAAIAVKPVSNEDSVLGWRNYALEHELSASSAYLDSALRSGSSGALHVPRSTLASLGVGGSGPGQEVSAGTDEAGTKKTLNRSWTVAY